MFTELFIRGLVIGFAVAAPVGPIGMLVINRTLTEGRLSGLATGLGAAVADTLYGCVGAFGLTLISNLLMGYAPWTKLLGGLCLCCLGIKTIRARSGENSATASRAHPVVAFSTTVLLTLANPVTILMFMAVFAGLGFGSGSGSLWSGSRHRGGGIHGVDAVVADPDGGSVAAASPPGAKDHPMDRPGFRGPVVLVRSDGGLEPDLIARSVNCPVCRAGLS